LSDSEHEIKRIVESYKAAVFAADAEAFIRLYHPAVRVFDTWGVWLYDGAPAWQRAVEGWFASLGTERVRAGFSEVQILAGRPLAALDAIVTYTAESAKGEALRSMQNRITWVLRETGHVLRIVHEHTSAPVGFDDCNAILTRIDDPKEHA
jgi:ketosteroid isomerase-like protein